MALRAFRDREEKTTVCSLSKGVFLWDHLDLDRQSKITPDHGTSQWSQIHWFL